MMNQKNNLMNKNSFYITTTLPYVNAKPHLGFALEIVHADIIARYHRLLDEEVFFNTGTDEHGMKIYQKARQCQKDTQEYVDEYAKEFDKLKEILNLSYNKFTRTTDKQHIKAAQEFWKLCYENGDIEKKLYKAKYCPGCELEKTDSELENGKCSLHPNQEIEIIEEENYFFKFSKYEKKLLEFYEQNPDFVVPDKRFNEIKAFVKRGLKDFSVSRLKSKMPWGIEVPGDDEHVMYVWFDALVNYISAIGWPDDEYKKWWPVVQLAGKDNLRQQSAMWQAMLMSAGIEPSKQIVIHGFITSDGQKMSKSVGNVVDPFEIVKEYGTDALRYYLARHIHSFEDSDFSHDKFKEVYNANLANGLGNLASRITTMAVAYKVSYKDYLDDDKLHEFPGKEVDFYNSFEINKVIDDIWGSITALDQYIQQEEPYKKIKTDEKKAKNDVAYLLSQLLRISMRLLPFMPETSEKILKAIKENKKPENLFPRKD